MIFMWSRAFRESHVVSPLHLTPSHIPVRQRTSHIQVTDSGNATLFYGVPDWVYEEEVYSADFALFWSPDSTKVAYLAFDETLVEEFTFPIYNPTDDSDAVVPYTTQLTMRYPKPGYPNPLVSVHVFDLDRFLSERAFNSEPSPAEATLELEWTGRQPVNDSIIMDVVWLSNGTLLVKEVNRNADKGIAALFDVSDTTLLAARTGSIVRTFGKDGEEADDGWIDAEHTVYPLPESFSPSGLSSYLDIVPNEKGYNHIALFSPASTSTPRFLTTGPWEVAGGIKAVDLERGLVYVGLLFAAWTSPAVLTNKRRRYFQAANPSSIHRNIFSVPLPLDSHFKFTEVEPTLQPTALTDTSVLGHYSADFSPEAGFYLLSYNGPQIPWQRVVKANDTGSSVHTGRTHLPVFLSVCPNRL